MSKINEINYIENIGLNNNIISKLIKEQSYVSKAKLYIYKRERNSVPKLNVLTSESPAANLIFVPDHSAFITI
jgi:hypothetical protein